MPDVSVLYFAQARDRLGIDHEQLTLSSLVGAGDVLAAIRARHPAHAALIERCRVAIDHQFVDAPVTITSRSEIALIPPVSGG